MSPIKVRLTRKLADRIDGVDVSQIRAGEQIEVSRHEADLLIAEGWAVPADLIDSAPDAPPRTRESKQKKRR